MVLYHRGAAIWASSTRRGNTFVAHACILKDDGEPVSLATGCGFRSGSTQNGWTSAWDGKKWLRRSARRDDVSWREDFGMAQTNGITA
jgi:hypothetical protein